MFHFESLSLLYSITNDAFPLLLFFAHLIHRFIDSSANPTYTHTLSLSIPVYFPSPPASLSTTAIMADHSGFGNRKFSINRNTGVPRPARRFSMGEPGLSGMKLRRPNSGMSPTDSFPPEASSKIHRQFRAAHEGYGHIIICLIFASKSSPPQSPVTSPMPVSTLPAPRRASCGALSEPPSMASSRSPTSGPTWAVRVFHCFLSSHS